MGKADIDAWRRTADRIADRTLVLRVAVGVQQNDSDCFDSLREQFLDDGVSAVAIERSKDLASRIEPLIDFPDPVARDQRRRLLEQQGCRVQAGRHAQWHKHRRNPLW